MMYQMDTKNSHIGEDLLLVVTETLADLYGQLASVCPLMSQDFSRDAAYISRRFQKEGVGFFTISLPLLGAWFDDWILKKPGLQRVVGFKPYNGLFPCFLRPVWELFSTYDLNQLDSQHALIIRTVRTILSGYKKLEVPCSQELVDQKLAQFLDIETVLADQWLPQSSLLLDAQCLLDEYFRGKDTLEITRPKHGPGAVAGRERHNEKWNFSTLYRSVHAVYPYWEYIFPVCSSLRVDGSYRSYRLQLAAMSARYKKLKRVDSPQARLLMVPKDSRGPRIISCEPVELMYLQQGACHDLVSYIQTHPWTKGHVNFDDQTVNNRLALRASCSKEFATIDLSDASDRVSRQLVLMLFPKGIARSLDALRSTSTLLPTGEDCPLHKYAPMGSALCFPVESLVFWALSVATIWSIVDDLPAALSSVYVYGDDIIVSDNYAQRVIEALESVDLKVNRSKTFIGEIPFRESCGVEAINGHDVTPFRVKKLPPQRPSDGSAIVAWVKYSENAWPYLRRRATAMLGCVERHVGFIPRVPFAQPFISVVTPDNFTPLTGYKDVKWHADKSYFSARLLVIKSRRMRSEIEQYARLQKDLSEGSESNPELVVDRQSTQIGRKRSFITYVTYDGFFLDGTPDTTVRG